jgi:hypothetical protein
MPMTANNVCRVTPSQSAQGGELLGVVEQRFTDVEHR